MNTRSKLWLGHWNCRVVVKVGAHACALIAAPPFDAFVVLWVLCSSFTGICPQSKHVKTPGYDFDFVGICGVLCPCPRQISLGTAWSWIWELQRLSWQGYDPKEEHQIPLKGGSWINGSKKHLLIGHHCFSMPLYTTEKLNKYGRHSCDSLVHLFIGFLLPASATCEENIHDISWYVSTYSSCGETPVLKPYMFST